MSIVGQFFLGLWILCIVGFLTFILINAMAKCGGKKSTKGGKGGKK